MTHEEAPSLLQSHLILDEICRRNGFSESTPENLSKELELPLEPLRAIHEYYDSGTAEAAPTELLKQVQSLVEAGIEKWGTDEERKRLLGGAGTKVTTPDQSAVTSGWLVLRALRLRMLTLRLP
jgi:hypothetical protein